MSNLKMTTLQKSPHFKESVKKLIEKSFGYHSEHDLFTDFAPLFQNPDAENLQNAILIEADSNKLIGHIGIWKRKLVLEGQIFPIALVGGVAISEEFRGQGYFRSFMESVLHNHINDTTFFLLWSDLSEMYRKLGFYEIGHQHHFNAHQSSGELPSPFVKVSWKSMDEDDLKNLNAIHEKFFESHPKAAYLKRDIMNWKLFKKITSSQLFLYQKKGVPLGYAVRDKGMDLGGIFHDYACLPEIEEQFFSILKKQNFWAPANLIPNSAQEEVTELFTGLIKVGNPELFTQLINGWAKETLPPQQKWDTPFLRKLFGPSDGNSPSFYRPLFIGGLESI